MTTAFVYVTDRTQFNMALLPAASLAFSQNQPCNIHICCHGFLGQPPKQFYEALSKIGVYVELESIGDAKLEAHPTCLHVTKPSLLKFSAVSRLATRYDKIVYFDNDILVFGELDIEEIILGIATLAAVHDLDPSETGAFRHIDWNDNDTENIDMPMYFNAGFMLFDSKKFNEGNFYDKYSDALDKHDIACEYKIDCTSIDQCALNEVFKGIWLSLPPTYNMQVGAKYSADWRTALVRHYGGPRKFIPTSLFRNDARDVRYLNKIRKKIGFPPIRFSFLYGILYCVNVARKYNRNGTVKHFLRATEDCVDAKSLLIRQHQRTASAFLDKVLSSLTAVIFRIGSFGEPSTKGRGGRG